MTFTFYILFPESSMVPRTAQQTWAESGGKNLTRGSQKVTTNQERNHWKIYEKTFVTRTSLLLLFSPNHQQWSIVNRPKGGEFSVYVLTTNSAEFFFYSSVYKTIHLEKRNQQRKKKLNKYTAPWIACNVFFFNAVRAKM